MKKHLPILKILFPEVKFILGGKNGRLVVSAEPVSLLWSDLEDAYLYCKANGIMMFHHSTGKLAFLKLLR